MHCFAICQCWALPLGHNREQQLTPVHASPNLPQLSLHRRAHHSPGSNGRAATSKLAAAGTSSDEAAVSELCTRSLHHLATISLHKRDQQTSWCCSCGSWFGATDYRQRHFGDQAICGISHLNNGSFSGIISKPAGMMGSCYVGCAGHGWFPQESCDICVQGGIAWCRDQTAALLGGSFLPGDRWHPYLSDANGGAIVLWSHWGFVGVLTLCYDSRRSFSLPFTSTVRAPGCSQGLSMVFNASSAPAA